MLNLKDGDSYTSPQVSIHSITDNAERSMFNLSRKGTNRAHRGVFRTFISSLGNV